MKKSFTLIEMLIAVVLFLLLFYLIMYSFRLYLKRSTIKLQLPNKAIAYEYLDRVISGYYPYFNNGHYFLKKENNEIMFVSLVPLLGTKISVIKLVCKEHSLIYYQDEIYVKYQNYLNLKLIKPHKLILLRNLKQCRIISYEKNNFLEKIKIIVNNDNFIFTTKSKWKDLNLSLIEKGKVF